MKPRHIFDVPTRRRRHRLRPRPGPLGPTEAWADTNVGDREFPLPLRDTVGVTPLGIPSSAAQKCHRFFGGGTGPEPSSARLWVRGSENETEDPPLADPTRRRRHRLGNPRACSAGPTEGFPSPADVGRESLCRYGDTSGVTSAGIPFSVTGDATRGHHAETPHGTPRGNTTRDTVSNPVGNAKTMEIHGLPWISMVFLESTLSHGVSREVSRVVSRVVSLENGNRLRRFPGRLVRVPVKNMDFFQERARLRARKRALP